MEESQEFSDWIREIQRSDRPEIDKLKALFEKMTGQIVEFAGKEIELARAIGDDDALVKVQIKMETIKTARNIFHRSYQMVTGKKAKNEHDQR